MARARKHDPRIPRHIDQSALPKGVYWDPTGHGRWYTFVEKDGKPHARRSPGLSAKLSYCMRWWKHRAALPAGRSTGVRRLPRQPPLRAAGASTRRDYEYCRKVVIALPTKVGSASDNWRPTGSAPGGAAHGRRP